MTDPTSPDSRPAAWAVVLFVLSSLIAVASIALFTTGYSPV